MLLDNLYIIEEVKNMVVAFIHCFDKIVKRDGVDYKSFETNHESLLLKTVRLMVETYCFYIIAPQDVTSVIHTQCFFYIGTCYSLTIQRKTLQYAVCFLTAPQQAS